MQDVLEGELAHGRQVQRLLDPADFLENPEREDGVVQTIPDDLLGVPGPLLVDLLPRELVFSLPQQLASHVVERFLLHVQGQALRLDCPPYVREDPAVDPPEPFAEVKEVREVAGELEPRNPVLGGAVDEHGQVVAVDVVSGDDAGVELVDELDEPLDDFPLLPLEDAGLDFTGLPVLGRFPRLTEDDAGAGSWLALDLEGYVLELDHLRIPPERPAERLRRLDDEEVRLESGVFDRDALPFPRAPEELDHR